MKPLKLTLLFVVVLFGTGADASSTGTGDVLGVIREFGFPVFVALWFMWRVEKRMDRFTEAIQNLLTAVTIMAKTVDGWHAGPVDRAPERQGKAG